ncbi:MAG: Rpn family recombination-promoting nuclease/putative transposase [Coriobacteriales bacterium]|nr:Rpn family recombination-promoting nuclease/putative transposase [Coriobacteriales bacterium]
MNDVMAKSDYENNESASLEAFGKPEAYEKLRLSNNFLFSKVMLDEELCKETIETILKVPIERIAYLVHEATLDAVSDSRSVRLDVYVKDGKGTSFDLEMQVINKDDLRKRSRYYHSLITIDQLEKSIDYSKLPDSYVIFICNFDLFKENKRIYWFENTCLENQDLTLRDGTHTIFLAASAPRLGNDTKLDGFLDYLHSNKPSDDFTKRLEAAVIEAHHNQRWKKEYMFLEDIKREQYELGKEQGISIGKEKGRAEGLEEGLEKGFALMSRLIDKLLSLGRIDDAARVTTDATYRDALLKEFHLTLNT